MNQMIRYSEMPPQLFQTPATGRQPHTQQQQQQQQHEQQSATGHLREASRLAAAAEAANLRQVPKGAEESQQVGARMLAHKPAGPQTQMSLAGGGGGGGGAMQQPPPPLASSSNARLSNTSEPPVSYYSQHQHQQHHQQQPQSQHYQVEQHPNEIAPHLGLMGARRTGQPQGQVMYAAQTNATQLPYQPAGGFSSGAADTPLVPQGGRNARQQSPYLQQQQQQQQIPVRHNQQQQQQQLVSEPNTMLPHQQQRGYARPAPNQALANNFNPSVNIPTQVQQVQQPHQQPLVGGPSGDLMAPGSDSFAQSSAPLLQQQLNRQRPPTQLQHEPQHYQLDVPIQQAQAQPQAQPHQQHQQHASFAYQQQQAARPLTGHKQRPMQPGGGPHRPPQQRQQVSASAQLQQHQLDVQPQQFPCNPTPPLTPNRLAGGPPASLKQQPPPPPHPDDWSLGYPQQQQPVNGVASYHQEAQPSHQIKQRIHQMPNSQPPANTLQYHPTGQPGQFIAQPLEPQAAPVISQKPAPASAEQQIRLTLPLRDGALVGPFKLEHELQFATKSFHLRPQLFEQLSKAALQHHHQTAAVIQELQFRAYLSTEVATQTAANSLLAANQHNNNHNHHYHHQHQRQAHTNNCQWPEMFQVSCNQQLVHLDRSTTAGSGAGAGRLAHRAVDLFPYCQPGDNLLELQLHGCYCSHEYVLELVDRPTLKAFTNSCFKTRVLSSDACLAKLSSCFGKPSFACQLPAAGIINEYLTEYLVQPNGQQVEQTRLKISLRCPLSGRRMRTPTRGPNCTHLQCFDLESFLMANRERTRWSCPICALPVPFNMLELDQHQIGICQSMAGVARTDEVLVNSLGQWQAYQPGSPPLASQVPMYQHQASSKANGITFHQQPTVGVPMRPARGAGPPTHWDQQQQQQQQPPPQLQQSASPPTGGPVRRPPSSMGAHQTASKAKRPLNTNPNNNSTPPYQSPGPLAQTVAAQQQTNFLLESPLGQSQAPDAELSPLAAMERTIIHHEQQMGPPPFDANILTASSSPLRSGAPTPSAGAAHSSPSSANNATPSFASPQHHHQHHQPSPPDSSQLMGQQQAVGSPARHVVVASPQQQPARLAQSPLQQSGASHNQQSNSTPATPLLHAAPETPATPGQPGSMQPQSSAQQQLGQQQQQQQNVDHQPLSNGSASAASITSTSTLTPSGQSLGSVGMGGDSRCNTAPLQNALGSLDDLVQVANSAGQLMNSSSSYSNKQQMAPVNPLQLHHHQLDGSLAQSSGPFGGHHLDQADKGDILMSTLMMEAAGESGQPSELALALEEAEWKQQLDRGKSQHLANFLNEPLMNKQQLHQQQNQHPFAGPASEHHAMEKAAGLDGANKMLSNSLSHSDDEGLNQLSPGRGFGAMDSPSSELLAEQLHQQHQHPLDSYANYLDSNAADDGAGLPPDDSILDLFER